MAPPKTTKTSRPATKLPNAKTSKRPSQANKSILNFFQKVDRPEDSMFVGGETGLAVADPNTKESEDIYGADDFDPVLEERYNEAQLPSKRRKLSDTEGAKADIVAPASSPPKPDTKIKSTKTTPAKASQPKKPRKKGPFLDDSDSESEDEAKENTTAKDQESPPTETPPPKSRSTSEGREDLVSAPELGKRFARAAVARPGQVNPISLGEEGPSSNGGGGSTSAFSKLMSGHAEDAAWATAAATESASRGKPAYTRTCPFYKIMPGFHICVDAFRYGAVEGCRAYFLSHFHSDHYIGLSASWTHGPIYCSKVTGSLVKSQLKTAEKYVVELDFEKKVPVPGTDGVYVTMISANHCPGSSLFLFEKAVSNPNAHANSKEKRVQRILHCGDFRACPAHMEHPPLKPETIDALGKVKQQKIDVCYLDTTYLNPRYSFPPQNDVIRACAELCLALDTSLRAENETEWNSVLRRREGRGIGNNDTVSRFFVTTDKKEGDMSTSDKDKSDNTNLDETNPNAFTALGQKARDNRNRLLVVCGTYSIGKERICKAIALALKTKIFASPAKIRMCSQLGDPELASLMTDRPHEAQVHMQMLMELRAETLAEYLDHHRPHFGRVVGFRPSGWNYRPTMANNGGKGGSAAAVTANMPPSGVPTTQILHGPAWRTRFGVGDLVPQQGSSKDAMCFGAPYSEHSSFRELMLFVMGLRIEKIVPTVNVGSEPGRRRMKGWTDRWLSERRRGGVVRVVREKGDGGEGALGDDGEAKDVDVEDEEDEGKKKRDLPMWDGRDGTGGAVYW
ncbi:hypothetical protein VMCG_07280 [Cytospora schulzeri]|uniref:DNA repair metallo-beta-lactamase domain-containing protein n=1 Tax=Cytospora schulzeri TaxID=448051 RepID=A0A423WAH2_9PEZI|nr:hypothetical protein VMCG_07280 [Valsa malicola]